MKLHANAALSLNKHRALVGRVLDQGWSLAKAAEAAEVSEPTARKWVARYPAKRIETPMDLARTWVLR